jgi:hypothetical protein
MFEDNPSEAEQEIVPTPAEKRKYLWFLRVGYGMILSTVIVFYAVLIELLPEIFSIIVITFPVPACFLIIIGVTKGRDRRTSISEVHRGGSR